MTDKEYQHALELMERGFRADERMQMLMPYDVESIEELIENVRAKVLDEVYAIALNENHDTLIEWLQANIRD